MPSKYLITVVGPTAIGKTKLAIALAKYYKTEIISADSRQFYREMSIGTAVPSKQELEAVPHHFIQHKSIQETYNVGDFEKDTLILLELLFKNNDLNIMVGGSGLYVDAEPAHVGDAGYRARVADAQYAPLDARLKNWRGQ